MPFVQNVVTPTTQKTVLTMILTKYVPGATISTVKKQRIRLSASHRSITTPQKALRVLCFRLASHAHIASALSSFLSWLLSISPDAATRPVEMNLVVHVGSLLRPSALESPSATLMASSTPRGPLCIHVPLLIPPADRWNPNCVPLPSCIL